MNLLKNVKNYFSRKDAPKNSLGIYDPSCGMNYSDWKMERASDLNCKQAEKDGKLKVDYIKSVKNAHSKNQERYLSSKPAEIGEYIEKDDGTLYSCLRILDSPKEYWLRRESESRYSEYRYNEDLKQEDIRTKPYRINSQEEAEYLLEEAEMDFEMQEAVKSLDKIISGCEQDAEEMGFSLGDLIPARERYISSLKALGSVKEGKNIYY